MRAAGLEFCYYPKRTRPFRDKLNTFTLLKFSVNDVTFVSSIRIYFLGCHRRRKFLVLVYAKHAVPGPLLGRSFTCCHMHCFFFFGQSVERMVKGVLGGCQLTKHTREFILQTVNIECSFLAQHKKSSLAHHTEGVEINKRAEVSTLGRKDGKSLGDNNMYRRSRYKQGVYFLL